jgi:hypothetical protein
MQHYIWCTRVSPVSAKSGYSQVNLGYCLKKAGRNFSQPIILGVVAKQLMRVFAVLVGLTGLNDSKTAVISLIDNVDLVSIFVAEHIEVVID